MLSRVPTQKSLMKHYIVQIIILWGVLVSVGSLSYAKDNEQERFFKIYDLEDGWQVYDTKYNAYVPYIEDRHNNSKTASFWLDTQKYQGLELTFKSPKNVFVFINKQLCKEIKKAGWVTFKVDSLRQLYKGQKKLFFTFYDRGYRLPLKSVYVGYFKREITNTTKTKKESTIIQEKYRKVSGVKNFVIVVSAVILGIFTLLLNFHPKIFSSYYSLQSSVSSLSRKDIMLINKPFNIINMLFLATHSLTVSLFYILAQKDITGIINVSFKLASTNFDFVSLLLNYAVFFAIVFGLFFLKYILLKVFGVLLSLEKIEYTHFYEYMRLSQLFYTVAVIFPIFMLISKGEYTLGIDKFFIYIVIGFHFLQTILVSFYVNKRVQLKNLYLFYYLCSTELTPLLIGIKLLLFN